MRRVSRKKQDVSSSREEAKAPPAVSGTVRRQQPPQEILQQQRMQQQRKKLQEDVSSLTAKNYRLAKELADLRLKHRDECKHVTRLTMENMNLASRCRESISHVAMLKKELAMQQKRTAQALASQREQTKRMADSLTNSFISFSSPDSKGFENRSSPNEGRRSSVGVDEDENVMRLISNTPSPNREALHSRFEEKNNDGNESFSQLTAQKSSATKLASTRIRTSTSPMEESRDSPATTVATTPTNELEDETMVDSIAFSSSSLSVSPGEEKNDLSEDKKTQKRPVVYSTPKRSERSKSSRFHVETENDFHDTTEKSGLFPISASPQVFNKSKSGSARKSYDEGFPSDTIEQPDSDSKSKRKLNLMNSIDAFEKSFSTDFPDSFTPKESSSNTSSPSSGSGQNIYNPFFATPEKSKSRADSSFYGTPDEEQTTHEPPKTSPIEYTTPPKNARNVPSTFDKNDKPRPKRPEKTIPSAARARYERALGSRVESSARSKQHSGSAVETPSDDNSPGALYRRMQQKKKLDKNLESASNGSAMEVPSVESSPRNDILSILDTFEHNEHNGSGNTDVGKEQKPSKSSRFQGPIKSLRRRSVKKPISYAEPPLNTKLRRGDVFFPKTSPNMTGSDDDNRCDEQNRAPNRIQPAAVVSP